MTENKYIRIDRNCFGEFMVRNKRHDQAIAFIEFDDEWRTWIMRPLNGAVFSADCLRYVCEFMEQKNNEKYSASVSD